MHEARMQFIYSGDDGSRIVSWFKKHLQGIASCLNSGLPEASLTLLYSGIDTLGLLNAPPDATDATRQTFLDWCEQYLLTRLKGVDGESLTALDLYAARCGVLHTSSSVSRLGREGEAHEVWYRFQGQAGVNLMANVRLQPVGLDIEHFAIAFKEATIAFLTDLNQDQAKIQTAETRAGCFFRWGKVE
jgi:hypothetical protein